MRRTSLEWLAATIVLAALVWSARPGDAFPRQVDSNSAPVTASPLDYEFFRARVEPVFLKDRPGHSRCYSCHGSGNGPQYLVHLSPGSTSWTDEQSRQIFDNVSKLVNRKDPMKSRFLIHPLSPLAGGDIEFVHTGGRQFESKDDPDWQAMAAWASGQTLAAQK